MGVPSPATICCASFHAEAGSIVMRLAYRGRSVLFTGDTVGRHIGGAPTRHLAAEEAMVQMAPAVPIDSDVIIAPHHGADNASSTRFIQEVSPSHVVFSAGSQHEHPRHDTAQRYLSAGVPLANIFRTDRGDNEGGAEWAHQAGTGDSIGDDDVLITIDNSGVVQP